MPLFDRYIGVDYSGAGLPDEPAPGLRVCSAGASSSPRLLTNGADRRWTRQALFHKLAKTLRQAGLDRAPVIIGIDHAFSFPAAHVREPSWRGFLHQFCARWQTDAITVAQAVKMQPVPAGNGEPLRLTERRTVSARSVFSFRAYGVAYSTFAGLPWLLRLREVAGDGVHFWPFDGFEVPAGKSVVTEVYPSLFRRLLDAPSDLNEHQRDAWLVSRWLQDRDQADLLVRYFAPPLTEAERVMANLEGWILGVM